MQDRYHLIQFTNGKPKLLDEVSRQAAIAYCRSHPVKHGFIGWTHIGNLTPADIVNGSRIPLDGRSHLADGD